MKLQIIVGSTRPARAADKVVPWVTNRAALHEAFDTEVLDLRDWPLPMFGEHMGSIGDPSDPSYSDQAVRQWNRKIAEADAYLVITPEYNHSVPGELKNAIDSVFVSFAFRNKPMAMVGYSGGVGGAIRAIEHLVQIAVEVEAAPLRSTVVLPYVDKAFTEDGEPADPATEVSLQILLEDLAWWATALQNARAAGELLPGKLRARMALAAGATAAPTR
ncbi:MAG TPA: NAD(P)H-dependent oxidoreductase [Streptosporangiaceae bacterium]|nr:NAD(P)H-dependent oxidoreductase [Streptosporangiaceae bacterium]